MSLTPERRATILGLIEAGASEEDAAQAADVSPRTLREWVSRGRGRSARGSTPELRAFAAEVAVAKARARASAAIRIFQKHPERWSELQDARAGRAETADPEEVRALARELVYRELHLDPTALVPPCPNRRCRCAWHRERTPEELLRTRAAASRRTKPREEGR